MAKYILRPSYGDMSVKILGNSVSKILKSLAEHWEDELNCPQDFDKKTVDKINSFLNTTYSSVAEIMEAYNKNFDEDYSFDEAD